MVMLDHLKVDEECQSDDDEVDIQNQHECEDEHREDLSFLDEDIGFEYLDQTGEQQHDAGGDQDHDGDWLVEDGGDHVSDVEEPDESSKDLHTGQHVSKSVIGLCKFMNLPNQ